jgi:hypothetical protein
VSSFRPKGGLVYVTSRKQMKTARRLANEVGVQRAKAVKAAQARAEIAVQDEWIAADLPHLDGRAWHCTAYRVQDGKNIEIWDCTHNHKSPETAKACTMREVKRKNKWTGDKVASLVKEVTAKG